MQQPIEILNALIDESDDLIRTDTDVKKQWRALTPDQQRQAGQDLLAQHRGNVDEWRKRNGLAPLDWNTGQPMRQPA